MDNNVISKIREFLEEDPLYQESIKKGFSADLPLLDSGALDSLGILNLVVFLETQFSISVGIDELSEAHFSTLQHIEKFVQQKINER